MSDGQSYPSCHGSRGGNRRILFVGDSWVSRSKLDQGVIDTLGEHTKVCSLCFSGYSSGRILDTLRRSPEYLAEAVALLGGRPHAAVIVCGINDVIAHRGGQDYAGNVVALSRLVGAVAESVYALEIPWFDQGCRARNPLARRRNDLFRLMRDGGRSDVIGLYRAALARQPGAPNIIPYDGFSAGYAPGEFPDGIHMPPDRTPRLGAYIASHLAGTLHDNSSPVGEEATPVTPRPRRVSG